jgi:hypothetical protein
MAQVTEINGTVESEKSQKKKKAKAPPKRKGPPKDMKIKDKSENV